MAPGADAASHHLLCNTAGLEFEKVRSSCVDTGNQQAYTVRSAAVLLSVCLSAVCNARSDVGEKDGAIVCQARGEGLLAHEVGEDAGIRGETGEGDAVVGVDGNDLLLV